MNDKTTPLSAVAVDPLVMRAERWSEMVTASKEAVEDFNDFADDRAIVWAADRIKSLENALSELIDVAAQCDSWEHFPSRDLDKAVDVLNA